MRPLETNPISSWAFLPWSIFLNILVKQSTALPGLVQEYCQWETFEAECPPDHVVVMQKALYGRMRLGKCISKNFGHEGCSTNIQSHMDSMCSGKTSCSVHIPDDFMKRLTTCDEELEKYVEAGYYCQKVVTADRHECHSNNRLVVKDTSGYLSSNLANTASIGTRRCPWVITAGPGQKINLTLIDFGLAARKSRKQETYRQSVVCQRYANIREPGSRSTTTCGEGTRVKNIYVSDGHQVEVEIIPAQSEAELVSFLIQFNVTGCADPVVNSGTSVNRYDDKASITCVNSKTSWDITCVGNTWIGEYNNCTHVVSDWDFWEILSKDWSSPQGILLVTCLGVALGIVIGIFLLITALLCMRRRRKLEENDGPEIVPVDGSSIDTHEMLMTSDGNTIPLFHKDDPYGSYRYKSRPRMEVPHDSLHFQGDKLSNHDFIPPQYITNSQCPNQVGFSTFNRGQNEHIYELPK